MSDDMNAPRSVDVDPDGPLLPGIRNATDAAIADLFDAIRAECLSTPPVVQPMLAEFFREPAAPPSTSSLRRWRASIAARIAALVVGAVAATSGLAMAHALPAPLQDTASSLGIGRPAARHRSRPGHQVVSTPTSSGRALPTGPVGGGVLGRPHATPGPGSASPAGIRPVGAHNPGAPASPGRGPTTSSGTPSTTTPAGATTPPKANGHGANGSGNGNSNGNSNGTSKGNGSAAGKAHGNAPANTNGSANSNGKGKTTGATKTHPTGPPTK